MSHHALARAFSLTSLAALGLLACAKSDAVDLGAGGAPQGAGGAKGDGGAGAAAEGATGSSGGATASSTASSTAETSSSGTGGAGTGGATSSASGVTCGDNVAEGGEACDGVDLAGETCVTRGFASGTLACSGCAFDTAACAEVVGCENGLDDDGDGLVDAADPGCTGAGDDDELLFAANCDGAGAPVVDLTHAAGLPIVFSGTTVGLNNAFTATQTASCPTTPGGEVAFRLVVSQVVSLEVSLDNAGTGSDWDPVLYVRSGNCVGTQVGCNDDANGGLKSELVLSSLQPGTYYVFVDSEGSSGAYEIRISTL